MHLADLANRLYSAIQNLYDVVLGNSRPYLCCHMVLHTAQGYTIIPPVK